MSSAVEAPAPSKEDGSLENSGGVSMNFYMCKYPLINEDNGEQSEEDRVHYNACNHYFLSLDALSDHQVFHHNATLFCDGCCYAAYSEENHDAWKVHVDRMKKETEVKSDEKESKDDKNDDAAATDEKKDDTEKEEMKDDDTEKVETEKEGTENKEESNDKDSKESNKATAENGNDKKASARHSRPGKNERERRPNKMALCRTCLARFNSSTELLDHVKDSHEDAHICPQCPTICWTKYRLDLHVALGHRAASVSLDAALKKFKRQDFPAFDRYDHIGMHGNSTFAALEERIGTNVKCRFFKCDGVFDNFIDLLTHEMQVHNAYYLCWQCGFATDRFHVVDYKYYFLVDHHCPSRKAALHFDKGMKVAQIGKYAANHLPKLCMFCTTFSSNSFAHLFGHWYREHRAAFLSQQCNKCRLVFPTRDLMLVHRARAHRPTDTSYPQLPMPENVVAEFAPAKEVIENGHVEETMHASIDELLSSSEFGEKSEGVLMRHLMKKFVPPFKCKQGCDGQTFYSLETYFFHEAQHHGNAVLCTQCGKAQDHRKMGSEKVLTFGITQMHDGCDVKTADGKRVLDCPWCGDEVAQDESTPGLLLHFKEKHAAEYPQQQCRACLAVYPTPRCLMIHEQLVHPSEKLEGDVGEKMAAINTIADIGEPFASVELMDDSEDFVQTDKDQLQLTAAKLTTENQRMKKIEEIFTSEQSAKRTTGGSCFCVLSEKLGGSVKCKAGRCQKTFFSLEEYFLHSVAAHNLPYFCLLCAGVFPTKDVTSRDIGFQEHAGCCPVGQPEDATATVCYCPICAMQMTSRKSVIEHLYSNLSNPHGKVQMQTCQLCYTILPSPRCVAVHMFFAHGTLSVPINYPDMNAVLKQGFDEAIKASKKMKDTEIKSASVVHEEMRVIMRLPNTPRRANNAFDRKRPYNDRQQFSNAKITSAPVPTKRPFRGGGDSYNRGGGGRGAYGAQGAVNPWAAQQSWNTQQYQMPGMAANYRAAQQQSYDYGTGQQQAYGQRPYSGHYTTGSGYSGGAQQQAYSKPARGNYRQY